MGLEKRYCLEYTIGEVQCYGADGFWYTDKGIIIKWIILGVLFALFLGWFVGGYIHAKRRLKKGLPLLGYHRFLISFSERKRHGQVPQHHFAFYRQDQQAFYPHGSQQQQQGAYQPRSDGPYAEPPPTYNGDAPPQYYAPGAAATKDGPGHGLGVEMPVYARALPPPGQAGGVQGEQSSGVAGRGEGAAGEQGQGQGQGQPFPPRPQQAKAALRGVLDRFRK
ncbi:hypothetical protein BDU57DRAFT_522953 [Ampelomyces quisqualis]|uniref:Chitin synthesis regulation, congo red resistance, RCR protein n=1 Tax=Ampelomyces quisqualis TaxID=50730 RepID=A0A6A5QAQ0_AMPQU|nr:hypothetical protein BDU57DRAFT_522953 [Ampelomyces quisqualis]